MPLRDLFRDSLIQCRGSRSLAHCGDRHRLRGKLGSPDDAGLSFADAVIASFDVKAEEGNTLLIDATDFFRRDGIHVASILRGAGQGSGAVPGARSWPRGCIEEVPTPRGAC